jgi:predicted transporter
MKTLTAIGLVTIVLLGVGIYQMNKWWCGLKAEDMSLSSKYTIVSGCLVKGNEDTVWVAPDRYRGFE